MPTLQEAFAQVPDPRGSRGKRYPLGTFLILIMLATMSGYQGYRGVERFMDRYRQVLSQRLGLARQALPDYSTIRRLMEQIDFHQVAAVLTAWMHQVQWLESGDDCAVDGKGLANTLVHHKDAQQNFVNVVSVFQLRQGLVVGQQVFENGQESEIGVVQSLIEQLQVTGIVFSLDALHLQKKKVTLIKSQGNDYLISVKANQGKLYRPIVHQSQRPVPRERISQSETGHGRTIQRTISTFDLTDSLKQKWSGAQQSVPIHYAGHRQGKPYQADLYDLTSLKADATALMARIRAHWGIENRLHWVKDVVLQEDAASIHQPAPASLMAILRNLVVSLFRAHGYPSIVKAIDLLSHDFDRLLPLLGIFSP
jgi:predicted transposase YbfD/YdcC